MADLKEEIIKLYEKQSSNFKEGLKKEFERDDFSKENFETSNYRNISIDKIQDELIKLNASNDVPDLFKKIEQVLFSYILGDEE